jgi:hypothetical protein
LDDGLAVFEDEPLSGFGIRVDLDFRMDNTGKKEERYQYEYRRCFDFGNHKGSGFLARYVEYYTENGMTMDVVSWKMHPFVPV